MRNGGNAVDAAVATAFALAVTHPAAGNIGGGGFIVAYLAKSPHAITIDFRETAPKAALERMYLDAAGKLLPRHRAGARTAGVPGTVRGLGYAANSFGSKPWAELVWPAAKLRAKVSRSTKNLAKSLNGQLQPRRTQSERLADFPESIAAFGKRDGKPSSAGDKLVQPDLAATLERIAENGPDEFYKGRTADLIVEYMQKNNGLITREDLESYRAREREVVSSGFRNYRIWGMAPPSSGGIVVAEALNILKLKRYDLKRQGARSPRTIHQVTEAMKRAFFVRATELGDPDFVALNVQQLLTEKFADELAKTIGDRATPSETLAPFPIKDAGEETDTTHLSVIDAEGNAVALTYTLEDLYGSKATVAGAGFLLNNEMGDFNLIPERTDRAGHIGTKPNRIEPGKRMLSSQAPTIVTKNGKVVLVTGSPGGRTIPNTVLWVLLDFLAFDMKPLEAVAAPRTHHQWFPDVLVLEGKDWPEATLTALRSRGHSLRFADRQGDAHTIFVDQTTGLRYGLADPRTQPSSTASGD